MNILVFSWRDPKHPLAGGAEQVMHEHMKGWAKEGHKVTLFSSQIKGNHLKEETIDGIKTIRKGYQILGVHIAAFFWYLFGKHPNYDLVVDQFHGIPFFTPLYIRKPKLAVLQEVAKEVWLINHLPFPFNFIVGIVGYLTEPVIFLFYRSVPFMVGSNSAKKDLIDFGIPAKNITIVPHGVVLSKGKKFRKEKIDTVIFLGALAKDKGIEDAIRTFSILNETAEFNFWVVGRGGRSYLPELTRLARKLGVAKKTKFWGFVSQEKKFELLGRAQLLINPSVREGWGLVNIEANSIGTPVVAYKSPGLIDSVKDGVSGVLCDRNTPRDMAKVVKRVLSDKNLYQTLKQGASSWSKNFSWEKSQKMSLTLISSLVK